jgi:hypothetical protein
LRHAPTPGTRADRTIDVTSAERKRVEGFGSLQDGLLQASDWYLWGPYVSERQWGTVREDYSADGQAWDYLPHDAARSRAYRWGEDGLAGFCDIEQRLCLGLALWNGHDPILKERLFGLTGEQGNHGEDAKEYWWYSDALPSHAWNRWRYHYPQGEFPYSDLVDENGRRGRHDPEYELLDTGAFDEDRYWIVEVDYAKAAPHDVLMRVRITNAGPDAAALHVLPTAWFRNTWSWEPGAEKPALRVTDTGLAVAHPRFGDLELLAGAGPDGARPVGLACDNETNDARLYGTAPLVQPVYPKDGINDHVVHGSPSVSPEGVGTKGALWYQASVDPGQMVELRLRLRPAGGQDEGDALGEDFESVMAARVAEADEFYAELRPSDATDDEAAVMRQAFAGMLWSKKLYYYEVARWLDGDQGQPAPPAGRDSGRNSKWRQFRSFDIMSMPDAWEYPWFAAWDLGFHCVALAHVDPSFAKYQLQLLCREWFQAGNGALPAYEWDFGDVNPPVHAWAALKVFQIDGSKDLAFLGEVFDKLIANFTWWMNREDSNGNGLFSGGFLGLDNIGPIDRSHLAPGEELEQSDATGWMAFYSLGMAAIADVLHRSGARPGLGLVIKFLEHFAEIRDSLEALGVWDEADGFFYDQLRTSDGATVPVKVRSMVGVIPLLATALVHESAIDHAETLGKKAAMLVGPETGQGAAAGSHPQKLRGQPGHRQLLLSVVTLDQLRRVLAALLDEEEFLSPGGLRSLSQRYRGHPYELTVGGTTSSIDYEPAESTTAMFGGNSNWRGPVWFPLNYLLVDCLTSFHDFYGADLEVEYPTGSGITCDLGVVATDLRRRLISLFLVGTDGRRPCFGGVERLQTDPAWRDHVLFNEYFNGDDGAGLGASHQTGWTGVVADLICARRQAEPERKL